SNIPTLPDPDSDPNGGRAAVEAGECGDRAIFSSLGIRGTRAFPTISVYANVVSRPWRQLLRHLGRTGMEMQFEQFKSSLAGAAPPAAASLPAQALWWQA